MSIQNYVKTHGQTGYVQASLGANPGKLTVYWHGPVPDRMSGFARSLADPTSIVFVQVPYSIDQLNSESRRISELPGVVSAGPTSDFRGLKVRVDTTKVSMNDVHITSDVPITMVSSKGGWRPLFRDADAAPFSGGAWILDANDDICSTGFEVILNGTGVKGMTTADHCDPGVSTGHVWKTAGNPQEVVGSVLRGSGPLDTLVLTGGASYQPLVYTGAWDSGVGDLVEGFSDPLLDEDVCDGGGLTGEVCDLGVVEVNEFTDGVGPGYTTTVAPAEGGGSAGPGDSGGPSYTVIEGQAIAQGTISEGLLSTESACPASAVDLPRTCFREVFHPNIDETLTAINATVAFG